MKIDSPLHDQIQRAFAPLNHAPAASGFPAPGSLSATLEKANPSGSLTAAPAAKTAAIVTMFATATVDMWLRAVHSLLVSASLTKVSPIWASVTGYYSSHYSVRSIAHLLGFFQMFSRRKIVRLEYDNGRFSCVFESKTTRDPEHRFYWRVVKSNALFAGDPFFTQNLPGEESDVGHRNRANYADHLSTFPTFHPLGEEAVRSRIERISEIEFLIPPIPKPDLYPDIESVQVVAYHRLVRCRELLDTAVGTSNRFWGVHRDPPWARHFIDYQITEPTRLGFEYTL